MLIGRPFSITFDRKRKKYLNLKTKFAIGLLILVLGLSSDGMPVCWQTKSGENPVLKNFFVGGL